LVLQNRTAGANASAGDKSSERVDNQPLNGCIYEFSQASPKLKFSTSTVSGNADLTSFPYNGLQLYRAAIGDSSLQNAPDAKIWSNCSKKSKLVLQPGTMRKTTIMHKHECTLLTLLNRMRNTQTSFGNFIGGSGRSQLVHLSEMLRTAGTNPVTVQYEMHYEIGCFFRTTIPLPLKSALFVSNIESSQVVV